VLFSFCRDTLFFLFKKYFNSFITT